MNPRIECGTSPLSVDDNAEIRHTVVYKWVLKGITNIWMSLNKAKESDIVLPRWSEVSLHSKRQLSNPMTNNPAVKQCMYNITQPPKIILAKTNQNTAVNTLKVIVSLDILDNHWSRDISNN